MPQAFRYFRSRRKRSSVRALIIKAEPLAQILSGEKVWELRGSRTHIRGRISLIESGSGLIIGEADLIDCIGPLDAKTYERERNKHRSSKLFEAQYPTLFAWVLENAHPTAPVAYDHPQGAII
jgi:hypothetical protein